MQGFTTLSLRRLGGAGMDWEAVQGKPAGLLRASRLGLRIPETMVITLPDVWVPDGLSGTEALTDGRLMAGQAEAEQDVSELDIQILECPLKQRILELLPRGVAVRSAGSVEDGLHHSFAGVFESSTEPRDEKTLVEAIRLCWRSAFSKAAMDALCVAGTSAKIKMQLVVQDLVRCDVSGVAFSIDPVDGQPIFSVEANWGQCTSVVSGRVQPDRYRIELGGSITQIIGSKEYFDTVENSGNFTIRTPDDLRIEPCLNSRQLAVLKEAVDALAGDLGLPVDVEWGFSKGELYIFQCRPVTVAGTGIMSA